MKFFYILLLSLFLGKGCSDKKQVFQGEFIINQVMDVDLKKQNINFKVDAEAQTLTGHSGCNQFFSKYKLDNNVLSIYDLGSTKKLCGNMEVKEKVVFACFRKSDHYSIEDNIISFFDSSNKLLMKGYLKE